MLDKYVARTIWGLLFDNSEVLDKYTRFSGGLDSMDLEHKGNEITFDLYGDDGDKKTVRVKVSIE